MFPEVHRPAVDPDGEMHVVVDILEQTQVAGIVLIEKLGFRRYLDPREDLVDGVVDLENAVNGDL